MKNYKALVVLLLVFVLCSVTLADNESQKLKASLYVLTDRNITPDTSNIDSRNQIADWWEPDLINVLARNGGYDAKLIQKPEEFVQGPESYLLIVKIVNYDPGSKAARMFVGFGAGACSMDLHIEFFSTDNQQIFAKDDHVASSRDWKFVARKMNMNILKYVKEALNPVQK
jgi:hypothetical protein